MEYKYSLFSPMELRLYRVATSRHKKTLFYKAYELVKPERADITPFKNKHKSQRCFILGGGPSLRKIDPAPLKSEITFGVNGVFLIFDWLGFQPTYYTVEDWFVYEDRFDDIRKLVTRPQCFFPVQFSTAAFDRENHHYFRAFFEYDEHPRWPDFSRNAAKFIWSGGTITYVCMQLAFYMGFESVYLVGMDHNYSKPGRVKTKGTEWISQGDDPNHFHPDYFGKGYRWHDPKVDRMELAYKKAKKYFEADGRKIYNATIGGCLEVFKRVDYNTLF